MIEPTRIEWIPIPQLSISKAKENFNELLKFRVIEMDNKKFRFTEQFMNYYNRVNATAITEKMKSKSKFEILGNEDQDTINAAKMKKALGAYLEFIGIDIHNQHQLELVMQCAFPLMGLVEASNELSEIIYDAYLER